MPAISQPVPADKARVALGGDAQSAGAGTAAHAPIDWLGQSEAVVADRARRAAEAARRASALSRWRTHAMPAPYTPPESTFRWDHAATRRFEATPQGLVIHLSDRCAIVVTVFALGGGCAIGHLPAHGDLFDHMDDPPKLGEWMDR